MFTTDRLLLRAFQDSDLDHLLALRNDYSVVRGKTFGPIVLRPLAFKDVLRSIAEEALLWFTLVDKKSGEFVGHCALRGVDLEVGPIPSFSMFTSTSASAGNATLTNRDAEFSIAVGREMWGRGLGMEAARFTIGHAFEVMGLQRVSLVVLEGNVGARALYAKLGFREEGRKRRGVWMEGRWEDIIYMGILAEEWGNLK